MKTATKTVAEMEALFGKRSVFDLTPPPARRRIIVLPLGPLPRFVAEEGRCCERAERVECVCRASWKCPAHGTRCTGSHD